MKSKSSFLRRLLLTEYRLTIWRAGHPENTYASSRGSLRAPMARATDDLLPWTLYKRGPFLLPERPVASCNS